jgi:hypothetical protein
MAIDADRARARHLDHAAVEQSAHLAARSGETDRALFVRSESLEAEARRHAALEFQRDELMIERVVGTGVERDRIVRAARLHRTAIGAAQRCTLRRALGAVVRERAERRDVQQPPIDQPREQIEILARFGEQDRRRDLAVAELPAHIGVGHVPLRDVQGVAGRNDRDAGKAQARETLGPVAEHVLGRDAVIGRDGIARRVVGFRARHHAHPVGMHTRPSRVHPATVISGSDHDRSR